MIVDDEEALLKLVSTSLQTLGYRVVTANSGLQALSRFAEEPTIALLFSDVVMPGGMSGYKLAEQVHQNRPEVKCYSHPDTLKGRRTGRLSH